MTVQSLLEDFRCKLLREQKDIIQSNYTDCEMGREITVRKETEITSVYIQSELLDLHAITIRPKIWST